MQVAVRSAIAVVVVSVLAVAAFVLPAAAQTSGTPVPAAATGAATTAPTAGDTGSSRTVNRIVLALLALAALLLVLAIWLWRTTKPVPSHLDGLDAMGTRRWRGASDEERASMLAPVHERRSELRDEDLIAPPEGELVAANGSEPAEAEAVAGTGEPVDAVSEDAVFEDAEPVAPELVAPELLAADEPAPMPEEVDAPSLEDPDPVEAPPVA